MVAIKFPTCTWCHRPIITGQKAVKFPCPNCGKVDIWRCETCRKLARSYVCPSCGFEGP